MTPHIFIATPAYDGKVHVQYAIAFAETVRQLQNSGVKVTNQLATSGSLLCAERNRLLERFWQSEATHILCIDSDLGWPAEAVIAMLKANKDFVAGVYPSRNLKSFVFRPVTKPDQSLITENHLIKMEAVPAGFMLISRTAIQKMRDKFPELYYSPKDPRADSESTYCLFNTELIDGEFWGEDYVFCIRARQAGIDIWVDPFIQFDHAGTVGSLSEIITNKKPELKVAA